MGKKVKHSRSMKKSKQPVKNGKWKPKRIGWYHAKWDRSASRHFGHSKSMGRKDRRAGGQAMLSKKR